MEKFFSDTMAYDFGVLIVDARHKPTADDVRMADYFRNSGKGFLVLANKLDKLKKSEIDQAQKIIRETLSLDEETPLILFSAEKGDGRDAALKQLLRLV